MTLPHEITTDRLRLILISPADAATMLAGGRDPRWHPAYPRRDDVDSAALVRDGNTWGPRHIVHEGRAVGSIGLFGPPHDGEVEVGYGLVEPLRRRGLATEALRGLLTRLDPLGVRVRASVLPENAPSLKLLAACGFTDLRGSNEEGELVLARPLPALDG